MAILTNEQSVAVGVMGLIGGVVLWYASRKVGAVVEQAIDDGVSGWAKLANAPMQAFRDPAADGSTVGTQAWFYDQVSDLKEWSGINPATQPIYTPYDGKPAPDAMQLPGF